MLFGIFVRSVEDGLEPSQTYDEVNKLLLLSGGKVACVSSSSVCATKKLFIRVALSSSSV